MTINDLNSNITNAQKKITNYNSIISSIGNINEQLNLCSKTLVTTGDLIGEAIVVDGKPADNGRTAEIAGEVSNCAGDFSNISAMASEEIIDLNNKISSWKNQIDDLQRQLGEQNKETQGE